MAADEPATLTPPSIHDTASGPPDEPTAPRVLLPWVLAGVFLLIALVLAIVAVDRNSKLDEDRGERAKVETVAGRFGEAFLSYDYQDPDGTKERVLALAGGQLTKQFEDAFPGLQELFGQAQGSATATVKGVWVGDIDDTIASAIVVADRLITGTAGPRREVDTYMLLDLVKSGGEWKVVGVSNLNFALSTEPVTSPDSTTTTVP